MGYSDYALQAFLQFEDTINHGAFNPKEREAIALVVSEVNGCAYCLAAHTLAAKKRGFSHDETLAIRQGFSAEAKLQAILTVAKSIAENKGKPDSTSLENLYQAGYSEATLLELIGLVTVRIFTNYVYASTEIPLDFPAAEPLPDFVQN
jgi:AhpD family alkylhydroperoxidase